MKLFYISSPILFLFLIGCSSTYRITNYSSKEDFYNKFNESAEDRIMTITMINDSSFYLNKARINNDILLYSNAQIPISEIKQASYNNHLQGAIPGLFIGPLVGAIFGSTGWIIRPTSGGNPPYVFDKTEATMIGFAIGLGVGAMVGIIVGHDHCFLFNP